MSAERWMLPEGIDEVLPPSAWRLELLRRKLLDLYRSWGYELVIPPLVEFLESLLTGTGNDLDLQTFKLIDQVSGRMMGVRADMTPQAARIDAHKLSRDAPSRLCYVGTALHTRSDGMGSSRSPMLLGVELYGHRGVESDLEIVSLMLATLESAGLGDAHLDLGHVAVFRGLVQQAGLDAAQEAELFGLLQRKDAADLRTRLDELDLPAHLAAMLLALIDLNGDESVLSTARQSLQNAAAPVQQALDTLDRLASALRRRHPQTIIHFDLAELRGYSYHTGLVFAAYLPGHGREIARGGRYDSIGEVFGRARPATGFSTDLKSLLDPTNASDTDDHASAILAPASDDDRALETKVAELRAAGARVVQALPGAPHDPAALNCDQLLQRQNDHWEVIAANRQSNEAANEQ